MMRRCIVALLLSVLAALPAQAHRSASQFTVAVSISPSSMAGDADPTLQAHTRSGATCRASVIYDAGAKPPTLGHATQHVGKTGIVRWRWHEHTTAGGGTASVACTAKGQLRIGQVRFQIRHRSAALLQPTPTAIPTPVPQARVSVVVTVSPDTISYGDYPTVTIRTSPGASCDISVVYDTGRSPTSYPEHTATADASGTITESGQWHMESRGSGGIVSATCSLAGQSGSGSADFTIG
jgi:hypothetical protein